MHNNWGPPEDIEEEELTDYQKAIIRTGITFLVFSILLLGAAIWGLSKILYNSQIIDGALGWSDAMIVSFIISVTSVWRKTFFK